MIKAITNAFSVSWNAAEKSEGRFISIPLDSRLLTNNTNTKAVSSWSCLPDLRQFKIMQKISAGRCACGTAAKILINRVGFQKLACSTGWRWILLLFSVCQHDFKRTLSFIAVKIVVTSEKTNFMHSILAAKTTSWNTNGAMDEITHLASPVNYIPRTGH
jgi:hypothetical protein